MKQLISINDFTKADILNLFQLTAKLKKFPRRYENRLRSRNIGLIFEKPSTRTWISFQAGITSLGGSAIYLGPDDIQLGIREEIRDVARVLNRYLSALVMRTFSHETITEFQRYFSRPVINGLSDFEHPCQALADHFTLSEKFPKSKKPILAFIGDGNNVLHSHLLLSAILGINLRYATPRGHEPSKEILQQALKTAKTTGAEIQGFFDPMKAVQGADAVYTDVWVSMGQEKFRNKKIAAFKGMQVNNKLLRHAARNALIMHCLPAHRGEEITNEVIESKNSIVFDQAENRLHVQKALLLHLLSPKGEWL